MGRTRPSRGPGGRLSPRDTKAPRASHRVAWTARLSPVGTVEGSVKVVLCYHVEMDGIEEAREDEGGLCSDLGEARCGLGVEAEKSKWT